MYMHKLNHFAAHLKLTQIELINYTPKENLKKQSLSCRTENNLCVVGGIQEHYDLTQANSCKTKDSHTEPGATNHTPPLVV